MAKKEKKLDKKEKRAKDFIDIALRKGSSHVETTSWIATARRLLDWYQGRFYDKAEKRKRFTVNTLYSLRNLILPSFIIQSPYIRVSAQNSRFHRMILEGEMEPGDQELMVEPVIEQTNMVREARKMEALMNHHYKKHGIIYEDRKAINDHLFYPFGVCKNGLDFDQMEDGTIAKDEVYRKRVCPLHIGWHPLATDFNDSSLIAEELTRSKSSLEDRYPEVKDATCELSEKQRKKFERMNATELMQDFINIYEVHDQETGMIYTFGGNNRVLLDKKENPYNFNGSHYDMLKFAGDPDEFLGIPMFEMIEDEVVAINDMMTLITEHFRKFAGQVFIEKGAADEDDIERMRTTEQGSIHLVNDIGKIKFMNPLNMGNEYFNIVALLQQVTERILGVIDFAKAGGSSRKSASESSYIQGDLNTRRGFFLEKVKAFVLSGVRKQAALKQQFQDQAEIVKASGELQFEEFVVTKEDIQGEYFFDFDVDTMAATDQAQLNNIINLLQVMAGNEVLHPVLRELHPRKLSKAIWKKSGLDIESFERGEEDTQYHEPPERENEKALDPNDLMPNPKPGENYEDHIKVHRDFVEERVALLGPQAAASDPAIEEIFAHIARTEKLMKREVGQDIEKRPMEQPKPPQQAPDQQGHPTQQLQSTPELQEPMGPMQRIPQ